MGVVYYKYKSAKETFSVPVPHSFVSVSELKQLILTSDKYGRGRTRGRGPREDIVISNSQTGEEFLDGSALIPQNSTVLIRRTAGQLSEKIVLFSSRKVTEDGAVASNKSEITESTSKSISSTEVQDEDAAIASIIDAAELKWEDKPSKRVQTGGRFTSGHYGHGPVEGETPPPGYVCRSCGVPGHFIQHCPQERKTPPSGYICYSCRIPGHFIHHCPTIGDPKFDDYKKSHSLWPEVSASPVDGIPSALAPAASVSVVDDLPAELHCRLCNKVMTDAVLTSKCCFDSFCDKCIRDYIITQSKCICGVKVLADDLVPNQTLRSTISNMLATRASSITSGTGKNRSSSGSNLDNNSANRTPPVALEMQSKDHHISSAAPDAGLQVPTEDNMSHLEHKLTTGVDLEVKDEGNSAGISVEKAVQTADARLKDGSESTSKVTAISGTLEPKASKTDQSKKKRKKADSTKIGHPNNGNYNTPFDPAYYNPYACGYPWVSEPYMHGSLGMPYGDPSLGMPYGDPSLGMPYGGYPMGPYGINSISNMPLPFPSAMQGNLVNTRSWETQPMLQRASGDAARSRLAAKPKEPANQSRSSERDQHLRYSHGTDSRNNGSRSSSDRRSSHRRSRDRAEDHRSSDYAEDHRSKKRTRASSPTDGDRHSRARSRHSSRSRTHEDSSDDERNFKRRWGDRR
ncbi:E3 ubiquitin ligase PARAQUAT TOLERANCE 3-like [Oryza brachyantha]|uniref:DWNN domain-containing protein n=1 Tax=Oryza brachyantha TaxID=4533 RepID=J3LRB6_ORYBR|nr:E3 ubiquitin ligase PARAQUAT TOLERANCE 3-like [Oryza brachyantha]